MSRLLDLLNQTKRVSYLYRKMDWMGASTEVNTYLRLPLGTPIPFSIGHGVWPSQFQGSQDILSTEPFHWSSTNAASELAALTKPTILAPHPWILTLENYSQSCSLQSRLSSHKNGPIIVGLPPSRTNDNQLYTSLLKRGITIGSILVKPRGPYASQSEMFWKSKGFRVYSAHSFRDLATILGLHHTLYCPNPSSIIFFASLQGLHVKLLDDVEWYSYDMDIDIAGTPLSESALWDSWKHVLRICSSQDALFQESSAALGLSHLATPQEFSARLLTFLESHLVQGRYLFTVANRSPLKKGIYSLLASLHLSYPSLQLFGLFSALKSKLYSLDSSVSPLYLQKVHSIDRFLQDVYYENLAVVEPSKVAQAGFGADAPLLR